MILIYKLWKAKFYPTELKRQVFKFKTVSLTL